MCQREGALGDEDSADMDGENGRGFEEYEWAGQKRIRATALLEGGFRGKHTQPRTLGIGVKILVFIIIIGSSNNLKLLQGCSTRS